MELKSEKGRYYLENENNEMIAEITFMEDDIITIDHTYVSPSLRGQGIARKLVEKVIEYAKEQQKKIKPECSYARKILTENPEYSNLVFNAS